MEEQHRLRTATAVFAVALAVHAIDHQRRGLDVLPGAVLVLGNLQSLLAIATIALVALRHRWAPLAAAITGIPSAVGFTVVHLLPHWGALSDSFTGSHHAPGVTGFSWFAALFEIAADAWLGVEGVAAYRRNRSSDSWLNMAPSGPPS